MTKFDELALQDSTDALTPLTAFLIGVCMKLSGQRFEAVIEQFTQWAQQNDTGFKRHCVAFAVLFELSEETRGAFASFSASAFDLAMETVEKAGEKSATADCLTAVYFALKTICNIAQYDVNSNFDKERVMKISVSVIMIFKTDFDASDKTLCAFYAKIFTNSAVPLFSHLAAISGNGDYADYRDEYLRHLESELSQIATENKLPTMRAGAISALNSLMKQFGAEWQALLPNLAQTLHQAMEDESVLRECKQAVETLEKIHGEPMSSLLMK